MAKNVGRPETADNSKKLAVIADCSWLLFQGLAIKKTNVAAAETNLLLLFCWIISKISERWGVWLQPDELRRCDLLRRNPRGRPPGVERAADLLDRAAL